jgi:hypothetical protein
LGHATPNSEKYFARAKIEERAMDEEWLSRARAAVKQHWQDGGLAVASLCQSKKPCGATTAATCPAAAATKV